MLSRFSVLAAPSPFIFDIDQALFIHFVFLNSCVSIFLIISSLGAERMANIPDNVSTMVELPTPVQLESLGLMISNMRVEAGFSEAHRRRTEPVAKATTPVTEATSSWDSDSDAEIVATIHNNE